MPYKINNKIIFNKKSFFILKRFSKFVTVDTLT